MTLCRPALLKGLKKLADNLPVTRLLEYVNGVLAGKIVAGELVGLACDRFKKDLTRKDVYFDEDRANQVGKFIECLPHVKGRLQGEGLYLEPWQCFAILPVFAFKWVETDLRRFLESYLEVTRKSGKSLMMAGVGHAHFVLDGEKGGEVYVGATTEEQAQYVYGAARRQAFMDDDFREYYGVDLNAKNMMKPEDGSIFASLIGNPGDGGNPHAVIVDEYHEHKTNKLVDTMQTGMGARDQPITHFITTAGFDPASPCFRKHEEVIQMLKGVIEIDTLWGCIWGIDKADDWSTVEAMEKANPNIDISVSRTFLDSQRKQALRDPSYQNAYKTKHLNTWTSSAEAFLPFKEWEACAVPGLTPDDVAGQRCCIGVDLSGTTDMTAQIDLFVEEKGGQNYYTVFPKFWLPEKRIFEPHNDHYRGWFDGKYLQGCHGGEIHYPDIRDSIVASCEAYETMEFAMDPWKKTSVSQDLEKDHNIECVTVAQTIGQLTLPMDELLAAVVSGRLKHPDDPILNWMAANLTAKRDMNGNVKPLKPAQQEDSDKKKIDGMVAIIIAISRALGDPVKKPSVYKKRGLIQL